MDSNIENKQIPLNNTSNQNLEDKDLPKENSTQKNDQIDIKKLITKIDNRVKTKVNKIEIFPLNL